MPGQAAVGIEVNLQGLDQTLQQIGTLHQALGMFGGLAVNPFNPALTTGRVAQGSFAGDNPGSFAASPGSGGGAPNYYPTPSQQGATPAFPTSVQQLDIQQVGTLNVQTAAVVNVYGAGSGIGTGPAAGVSGGNAPGSAPAAPQAAGTAPPGILPTAPPPATQNAPATPLGGAPPTLPPTLPGGGSGGGSGGGGGPAPGDPGFADHFLSQHLSRFPGMQGFGAAQVAGVTSAFQTYQAGALAGGASGANALGQGLGAAGGAISQAMGPLGWAALAGYGLHLGGQIGQASMTETYNRRSRYAEESQADMLGPLAGIPLLGIPFDIVRKDLQGRAEARHLTAGLQGQVGDLAGGELAAIAGRSTPGLEVGGASFGWGEMYLPGFGDNRRFRHMRGNEALENLGRFAGLSGFGSDVNRMYEMGRSLEDRFQGDPGRIKAAFGNVSGAYGAALGDAQLARIVAGGEQGGFLGRNSFLALAGHSVIDGDLSGTEAIIRGGRDAGELSEADASRLRGRTLDMMSARQHTALAGQDTAFAGLGTQRAGATRRGYLAENQANELQEAAVRREMAAKERELSLAEKTLADDPGNLENIRRVQGLKLERDQLHLQADAMPYGRIDRQLQGEMTLAGVSSALGAAGRSVAGGTGQLEADGAFALQRSGTQGQLAALQNARKQAQAAGVGADVLANYDSQIAGLQAQLTLSPVEQLNFNFGQASALGGAQTAAGQTALGYQTTIRSSGAELDFSGIRQGQATRRDAARVRLQEAQRLGLGPVAIAQAEAELKAAETEQATQPFNEIEGRYQADSRNAGFTVQSGQSLLGIAGRHEIFGGELSQKAQATLVSGLNAALDAALKNYQEVMAQPHTAGQSGEAQAKVDAARAAIDAATMNYAAQVAQSAFQVAGHTGAMASAGVAAATAGGFAPSGIQQQAVAQGLDAQILQAQKNAAETTDPNERMKWEQTAAQLQAQKAALPLRQIEERLAPGMRTSQAEQGIVGAEVGIARQNGQGSAETRDLELSGIKAAEDEAVLAERRVTERRDLARQGKIDPSLVKEAEAQAAQARSKATGMRTAFGQIDLPLEMRERKEQTGYELNVLQNTPGASGNIRGLLQSQMSQLEEEAAYLQNELQTRGPDLTEEGRHQIRQRLRQVGTEQQAAHQQLSHGWENRLISTVMNAPGSMSLEGRGLSMRDAVLRGVSNPHMGMNGGQLPFFLRQGSLDYMPQTGMPGVTGFLGGERGDRTRVPGRGNAGVDLDLGGGPGNPTRTPPRGGPERAYTQGGGAGATGSTVVTIEVVVKDTAGNILGRGSANGNAGGVTRGVSQGGLEDLLSHMGITVATQE
jgi:hypothetical protein